MAIGLPAGTIKVFKVDNNDNWVEDSLTEDDFPGMVTTSGDQTINGNKIFAEDVNISGVLTADQGIIFIQDLFATLNSDETGAPTVDAGLQVNRGTSYNSRLLWDETNDVWKAGISGSEEIILASNNWIISGGNLIGTQAGNEILSNTSNGSDNAYVALWGGGSTATSRGAGITAYGNEHANSGELYLYGGGGSENSILFYIGSNKRWQIAGSNGDFMPGSNGSLKIGRSAWRLAEIWTNLVSPFTGSHIYQLKSGETPSIGDALKLDINKKLVVCTESEDPKCIGLYTGNFTTTKQSHEKDSCGSILPSGTSLYNIAAVGDNVAGSLKGFNVCDEGGSISAGDLLVTASGYPGYLKSQGDDTIKSYTVGKALEDVTFSGGVASGIYGVICCG